MVNWHFSLPISLPYSTFLVRWYLDFLVFIIVHYLTAVFYTATLHSRGPPSLYLLIEFRVGSSFWKLKGNIKPWTISKLSLTSLLYYPPFISQLLYWSHLSWMLYLTSFLAIFPISAPESWPIFHSLWLAKSKELLSSYSRQLPSLI